MTWKILKFLLLIQKKYFFYGIVCVFLLDFVGFFSRLFEDDFNGNFHYPYDGDVSEFVSQLELGLKPSVDPINVYNVSYLHANPNKCNPNNKEKSDSMESRLVYLVKSSLDHFERRKVIRRTWGFEKRFSDVLIHTVFLLGNTDDEKMRRLIDEESDKYKDIIQFDFIDAYFNNTLKTMSGFKWVVQFCPNSRYYFFSDDDMYISTKNVLRFLRNPTKYPGYLQPSPLPPSKLKSDAGVRTDVSELLDNYRLHIKYSYQYDLPKNVTLYAGFVFVSSPQRHRFSKWYISLKEYPYNQWPPYISAGAYVLSKNALFKLYYTSFYTKHFRFDDIYLGLVAMKAGIQPFYCDQFHFYKKKYNLKNYKYVIASHGYGDPEELEKVWNEQKEAGNAR